MSKEKIYKRPVVSTTQLNIRVDDSAADAFRDFCSKMHVTQNEGLKLLLASAEQDTEAKIAPIQEHILKQQKTISALMEKEKAIKKEYTEKHHTALKLRRDLAHVMGEMLDHIIDRHAADFNTDHEPLNIYRPKFAKESLNFKSYKYPSSAGCMVITLDYLAYGMGIAPALFICGKDTDGTLIKLRWYPKTEYIGIPPRSEIFSYTGAQWLVGFFQSPDGATDMVAGIPLACIPDTLVSANSNIEEKMDLKTMLFLAESKKKRTK